MRRGNAKGGRETHCGEEECKTRAPTKDAPRHNRLAPRDQHYQVSLCTRACTRCPRHIHTLDEHTWFGIRQFPPELRSRPALDSCQAQALQTLCPSPCRHEKECNFANRCVCVCVCVYVCVCVFEFVFWAYKAITKSGRRRREGGKSSTNTGTTPCTCSL